MHKTYFNWSSGKDSAFALYKMQQSKTYKVDRLVTSVNSTFNRVSMHGLRLPLLELQAKAIGLPLQTIMLNADVSMSSYNEVMKTTMQGLVAEEYTHAIFGDIFLEDLKKYREDKLQEVGVTGVFPLWKQDTKQLLKEFLQLGFKAITVCVNAKVLDDSFVGREVDESFFNDLPENVDPCGENGEFHTFVYDGPNFAQAVAFTKGEKVQKSYAPTSKDDDNCFKKDEDTTWDTSFWYCDLLPK
ncbi:diphthine--ammonia ligase [Cellulophaga sp. 20_2_10]|uniref:Dph6-related ATP pyrophosphatase n=1 Tax=Cellulophaga sp. 20_2_10 TaxID=2942476 RepID=UPI00201ACBCD|nr:diphthine--ammonia ligase [Cellulophaga sp. 20_2_10]MCL5247431.1 diphthine--ammonia ligase [Cellulophaga sp. 20_2_10]